MRAEGNKRDGNCQPAIEMSWERGRLVRVFLAVSGERRHSAGV